MSTSHLITLVACVLSFLSIAGLRLITHKPLKGTDAWYLMNAYQAVMVGVVLIIIYKQSDVFLRLFAA